MFKRRSYDVVLLLGGNQGDRISILAEAIQMICESVGKVRTCSKLYESPAWGFMSEHYFLNQAVLVKTQLGPRAVLKEILKIEKGLGRVRSGKGYADRIVDIDILCWEEKIFWTSSLQVPHIRLHERPFALAPLKEILPNWRHPLLEKTGAELFEQLIDAGEVGPLTLAIDE